MCVLVLPQWRMSSQEPLPLDQLPVFRSGRMWMLTMLWMGLYNKLTTASGFCVELKASSWWCTGRPGVLRFMGSQRAGHDWATELNWKVPHSVPASFLLLFKLSVVIYAHVLPSHGKFPGKLELWISTLSFLFPFLAAILSSVPCTKVGFI